MPKRRSHNSFKHTNISRVHPNSESSKKPDKYEHATVKLVSATHLSNNDLDPEHEFELLASPISDMRSPTPPIEIIEVIKPPTIKDIRRTNVYASPSYRSFVVSPNSQMLREVSIVPVNSLPAFEEVSESPIIPKRTLCEILHVKPTTLAMIILGLILLISLAIVIVLSVLLAEKDKIPAFVSDTFASFTCSENCMMSLTPFPIVTIARWPFENSLYDINKIYNLLVSDSSSGSFQDGNIGRSIGLSTVYLTSNTHFLNISYQSWTIEAWLLITNVNNEKGIFGQCESSTTTDRCLVLSIKNKRLHMSFLNNDLDGSTLIQALTDTWRHVAFVYDYTLQQKSIYLDGYLEATTGSSGIAINPFKGSSGETTVGWATGTNIFVGRIDQMQIASGAKTACQILNDATLTAYYPFDYGDSHLDWSNNALHGTVNQLVTLPGRVNYAYSFQYDYSYFQSTAFTSYTTKESFSIALWIKPYYINGGTLLHLSTSSTGAGTNCLDILGFTSAGKLVVQLVDNAGSNKNIVGPTITVNVWTHVVITYSQNNGLSLYINGNMQGMTDRFNSLNGYFSAQPYLTVGNRRTDNTTVPSCNTGSSSISSAVYRGSIDELRIYSRELTINDICSLYNS